MTDLIARARSVVAEAAQRRLTLSGLPAELTMVELGHELATHYTLITGLADALEKAQAVVHAVERVIGTDTDISPGDGVWVDLSSWEAVEDLVGGREVIYERYRKMLKAEAALEEARRCRMCDGCGEHEITNGDHGGPCFRDCTTCKGTGHDR